MPRIVILDSSVALAVLLPDESSDPADQLVASLMPEQAAVPAHWYFEVANGLLSAMRRRRIDDVQRRGALADAVLLPVRLQAGPEPKVWSRVSSLAIAHGLSIYDAAYIELALRLRAPLATLDRKLAEASARERVELVIP